MNEAELNAGLPQTPGYRYADRVGDELFVAGQVPQDGSGLIIAAGDPAGQAIACLDNLVTVLHVNGFAIADVRRLVVYVVGEQHDLTDAWGAVVEWFDGAVPPATLLGIDRLGYADQRVEIDVRVVGASTPSGTG